MRSSCFERSHIQKMYYCSGNLHRLFKVIFSFKATFSDNLIQPCFGITICILRGVYCWKQNQPNGNEVLGYPFKPLPPSAVGMITFPDRYTCSSQLPTDGIELPNNNRSEASSSSKTRKIHSHREFAQDLPQVITTSFDTVFHIAFARGEHPH